MTRSSLLSGVMFAAMASQAFADDLTVGNTVKTPVATATASGGTPGNITVDQNAKVTIKDSGTLGNISAAATLNSNNFIYNSGILETNGVTNSAAVHILGGVSGDFTNSGLDNAVINSTGNGTGNYGILVDGTAPYTGNITLGFGSTILSTGNGSAGIAINAPMVGDLNASSALTGVGPSAIGLLVTRPITGTITVGNTMDVETYADTTKFSATQIDPTTGSAFALGSSISGGVLISGPGGADDLANTGSLLNSSRSATFLISPTVAALGGATPGSITIGALSSDTIDPTFSVVNRGSINDVENDPGMSTIGMQVGFSATEAADYLAAHPGALPTVTLTGGLSNPGLIETSSESDNKFATRQAAVPTDATALLVGKGAELRAFNYTGSSTATGSSSSIVLDPSASSIDDYYTGLTVVWNGQSRLITSYDGTTKVATIGQLYGSSPDWNNDVPPSAGDAFAVEAAALRNDGQITASMGGTAGGNVTGVMVEAGGSLTSIENTGSIHAIASSTDTTISNLAAYAIRDASGNLTSIINAGTISATATILDNNSQKTIAIDLSSAPSGTNQTISDSGGISGDVLFGHGANTLAIEGAGATVAGAVSAASGGTVDITVSAAGTGGVLSTADTRSASLTVGNGGTVQAVLSKTTDPNTPIVSTTGSATFQQGSTILLQPVTFLSATSAPVTYKLIQSTGSLVIVNPATYNALTTNTPFLYTSQVSYDGSHNLDVTLTRKSADDLGLKGNSKAIFEPLMAAAFEDDTYASGLLGLTTASQVQTAVKSTIPDIAGGVKALAVALTDESTGVVATRQRALLTAPEDSRTEFRFWTQEFYSNVHEDSSSGDSGFNGAGQGMALGAEWGSLRTGRYGVGYTFFSSQEVEEHPRDTKTDGDWNTVTAYAAWRVNNAFIAPQITGGVGEMLTRRAIVTSALVGSAAAQWKSYMGAGGITGGYILDLGKFQIIPTVAVDGLYLNESAYNEANVGGIGLSLKDSSQTSVRSFAGVIGQGSFSYDQGSFMPQIVAGWTHEFLNNPATIDGSFESAPGSIFHLTGPLLDPNRVVGGMSFAYVLHNWSAGVNYDASANSGAVAQSATISLSSRF